MQKNRIVLNTIVMKKQMDQGASQHELLQAIKDLGIDNVEIRREFIQDIDLELPKIKEQADLLGMSLFYSVNDEVIKENQVNPMLKTYISELKQIAGKSIKFNVGNFSDFQGDLARDLGPLLDGSYVFTVENNQVLTHSKLTNVADFMESSKAANLNISFVFDAANWYWINEDPIEAAAVLHEYSKHYIHLKNFRIGDNELITTPLLNGLMDWKKVMSKLPSGQYIGLEFIGNKQEIDETVDALLENL